MQSSDKNFVIFFKDKGPKPFSIDKCFSKYSTAQCPDLKESHALVTVVKVRKLHSSYNSFGQEDPEKTQKIQGDYNVSNSLAGE